MLYYNWHRYYEPRTGRYLRPDPSNMIQPQGHAIPYSAPYRLNRVQYFNNYIYVSSNPIKLIDPMGLLDCTYDISGTNLSCTTRSGETISCYATSGNNNPVDQCVRDVGPIPTGSWDIGAPTNNYAPLTGNNTCTNRSGFYIHGWGTTTGCIAIYYNSCRDQIMEALTNENGGELTVVE